MAMVRIKARVDNLTTLNATLMKGQVGECPIDRAKVLIGRGQAELVEGELNIPGFAEPAKPPKGDATERAVSTRAVSTETQTKKG